METMHKQKSLNEVVARFMGYVDIEETDYGRLVGVSPTTPGRLTAVPPFTEDLGAALTICDFMNRRGLMLYLEQRPVTAGDLIWVAKWLPVSELNVFASGGSQDTSLPKAITMAAIAALKKGVEIPGMPDIVKLEDAPQATVDLGGVVVVVPAIKAVTSVRCAYPVASSTPEKNLFSVTVSGVKDPINVYARTEEAAEEKRAKILRSICEFYK